MVKVLIIMHHIALCTPCIAYFAVAHLLHIRVDHVEPKTKNQAEQVQWVFGDSQASSGEDANIIVIKASSGAYNHAPCLLILNLVLCFIMIVH
jgi:hypothetical protein